MQHNISLRPIWNIGLIGAVLITTSCVVSQQRLGVHHLGNGKTLYGMVSTKADDLARNVEERFMRGLVSYDVAAMRATFSAQLAQQLSEEALSEVISRIRKEYLLDGRFQLEPLVGSRITSLDEGVRSEPFIYYDLVSASYTAKGKVDVIVRVYTVALASGVRVSGFDVYRDGGKAELEHPPINFFTAESTDNAQLSGRKILWTNP